MSTARSDRRRTAVLRVAPHLGWPALTSVREMEEVIAEVEGADIVEVRQRRPNLERVTRNAARLTRSQRLARATLIPEPPADRTYDVAVTCVMSFRDLWVLGGFDLESFAERRVCYITELWPGDIHHFEYFADVLSRFDVVYVNATCSVPVLANEVKSEVQWLPTACDTLAFLPVADRPRGIDVLSIGRRCPVQHAELADLARRGRIRYVFSTQDGGDVESWRDHRLALGQLAISSTFYVCHRSKFDDTAETGDVQEFGNRFFDGTSAGAIVIGDLPDNDVFRACLDWPGAAVHQAAGASGIGETILTALGDREDLLAISRRSTIESLRRHDWAHRWLSMMGDLREAPSPGALARVERLDEIADLIEKEAPYNHLVDRDRG